jgi:hypothetical protein
MIKGKDRIMACPKKDINPCNCTYPCEKKGNCCECIAYHRKNKQLPACYFPEGEEKKYDRSIENFIRIYTEGKIK